MHINEIHRKQAKELVSRMSLDEKLSMIGGIHGFNTVAIERLGIGSLYMSDASQGVNIRDEWLGEELTPALEKSTSFPAMIQLASTWNPDLARSYAQSIGEECRAGGIHILLGPGMNIYRHSQAGRNFEYLGEDPFLAARFIERYVEGLQSTGVMATLKHLAANNSDYFRRKSNSVVDDRTLREIYLPAFQAGVDAGARAAMTAYNLLNGEWCSENRYLITEVLRGEMGFEGLVMTDWWAVDNAEKVIHSGQDLEMPAAKVLADAGALIESGAVSESDIDRMVESQVAAALSLDLYQKNYKKPELMAKLPAHRDIALETARQGTVLLKNKGLLPLSDKTRVLLTGKFTREKAYGGGAAEVDGYDYQSLEQAMAARFPALRCVDEPSSEDLEWAEVLMVSAGTMDHEGWDRPFALPPEEEDFLIRMLESHPRSLVVVNSGGGIRMTGWHNKASAIIYGWYGGQTGNQALAEIIGGEVSPSGKLPISIEKEFADSPGAGYLPVGEELYVGWNGEGEQAHPIFDVEYSEGVFVGYRWYDKKEIEPLYPFGHGLSYTSFEYSDLRLSSDELAPGDTLSVSCKVRNAGDRTGTEVVQLYACPPGKAQPRPVRELKGFARVELKPGEARRIDIPLEWEALRYWDPDSRSWEAEDGEHRIQLGASSRKIHLECRVILRKR
jgi:beta-glucosidase